MSEIIRAEFDNEKNHEALKQAAMGNTLADLSALKGLIAQAAEAASNDTAEDDDKAVAESFLKAEIDEVVGLDPNDEFDSDLAAKALGFESYQELTDGIEGDKVDTHLVGLEDLASVTEVPETTKSIPTIKDISENFMVLNDALAKVSDQAAFVEALDTFTENFGTTWVAFPEEARTAVLPQIQGMFQLMPGFDDATLTPDANPFAGVKAYIEGLDETAFAENQEKVKNAFASVALESEEVMGPPNPATVEALRAEPLGQAKQIFQYKSTRDIANTSLVNGVIDEALLSTNLGTQKASILEDFRGSHLTDGKTIEDTFRDAKSHDFLASFTAAKLTDEMREFCAVFDSVALARDYVNAYNSKDPAKAVAAFKRLNERLDEKITEYSKSLNGQTPPNPAGPPYKPKTNADIHALIDKIPESDLDHPKLTTYLSGVKAGAIDKPWLEYKQEDIPETASSGLEGFARMLKQLLDLLKSIFEDVSVGDRVTKLRDAVKEQFKDTPAVEAARKRGVEETSFLSSTSEAWGTAGVHIAELFTYNENGAVVDNREDLKGNAEKFPILEAINARITEGGEDYMETEEGQLMQMGLSLDTLGAVVGRGEDVGISLEGGELQFIKEANGKDYVSSLENPIDITGDITPELNAQIQAELEAVNAFDGGAVEVKLEGEETVDDSFMKEIEGVFAYRPELAPLIPLFEDGLVDKDQAQLFVKRFKDGGDFNSFWRGGFANKIMDDFIFLKEGIHDGNQGEGKDVFKYEKIVSDKSYRDAFFDQLDEDNL